MTHKKHHTLFATLIVVFLASCDNQVKSDAFVHESTNMVTDPVAQLLKFTQVQTDLSLADVVAKTQQYWLRKPGTERWQIQQNQFQNGPEMLALFEQLNLLCEKKPQLKHYDYLVVPGALFKTMVNRMNYAIELFKQGISFDTIVLFASDRPLFLDQGEHAQAFAEYMQCSNNSELIKTEADILQMIYNFAEMPEKMRQLPCQLVSASMKEIDGKMVRPTTKDTVLAWMNKNPKPGTVLLVSNQPNVDFQYLVIQAHLPATFKVEAVGAAADQSGITLDILLDNLARILYQKLEIQKIR